ncbi:MAG TPA: hypothetical protein VHR15_12965 [Ktedonobacterales bacterium]|jgi:hypothetical protein|nr:hypothetical protein [Ktedonobacterales bacterium]
MRRLLGILAALALVAMLVFVTMSLDLSLRGAYVTNAVERFPGAGTVAQAGSLVALLGLLALLIATILGAILAIQQRQWGWLLLIVVLFSVAAVSMLAAGFQADAKIAVLTLVSPLALIYYDMRGQPANSSGLLA